MADHYQLFIDGEFVDSEADEVFETYEPATGKPLAEIARARKADVLKAIVAARKAFDEGPWPRMSGKERAAKLEQIAIALGQRQEEIATLETRDAGATIRKTMLVDVGLGAQAAFQWFAWCAANLPEIEPLEGGVFPVSENYVRHEPWGVCSGIVPWNYPLVMAAWKIAPAIAAGNCSVLKPASFTPITALELARVIQECDLPPGVVNIVAGPGPEIGPELIGNPMVDKTAFTGSTDVGRDIMRQCSETIKPVTLELGGKSPSIILEDADLDVAAAGVLFGVFFHNGQMCESGTRALVHRDVYDEFVSMLVDRVGKIVLGDPLDYATDLGPLVSHAQVKTVERYVDLGLREGAKLLCGGSKPEKGSLADGLDRDAYFLPTIFADVDNNSLLAQEEVFGPVLAVIPIDSDDHAVEVANHTIYGLSGSVWSQDVERARSIGHRLRAGTVWLNDSHMIDAKRPFGGYKQSGIGRELGVQGYNAYRQVKHLHLTTSPGREGHTHFGVLSANI